MKWSDAFVEYTEKFWQARRIELPEIAARADEFLVQLEDDEAVLVKYFLATLPTSDLIDYPLDIFSSCAKNALAAREKFAWCKSLPENIFVLNVAYPRINTEVLADCREMFGEMLEERVSALPIEAAILEVNRWCAEHATYRSTDLCTASPLTVFNCGYGRCGEESTFTVNALRSVGIAARQVYAPWWSHCDDNHAWVEAYDGEKWRYLGACEPEPILDRGWFNSAASRAMMIHARAFVKGSPEDYAFMFPNVAAEDIHAENGVALQAVTQNYAATCRVTLCAVDEQGAPAAGAKVVYSVLNMAQPCEIAVRETDKNGRAEINLGLGTVLVSVYLGGKRAEKFISTESDTELTLVLTDIITEHSTAVDNISPVGAKGYPQPFTAQQAQLRTQWLEDAAQKREQRDYSRHCNYTAAEERVVNAATEKDRAGGVSAEVIEDTLAAFAFESDLPADIFEKYLLSPRIGLEPLAPYRALICESFSPDELAAFKNEPRKIWQWIDENIQNDDCYAALAGTPAGALKLKKADGIGRKTLFCAVCRAIGVAARLAPSDGEPEFYQNGEFHRLCESAPSAQLTLCAADEPALFAKNYTVSRLTPDGAITLDLGDIPAGDEKTFTLTAGSYRVFTVNRLPNGNQLAMQTDISLAPNTHCRAELKIRAAAPEDMFECLALPPFTLHGENGDRISTEIFAGKRATLMVWLEVGREPTEHILNELRESATAFAAANCPLQLVLQSPTCAADPTLQKTLRALDESDCKNVNLWTADFAETVPTVARRMFGDPDKLPLVLLADGDSNGIYSVSGYNVGTAELLIKMLSVLGK